MESSLSPAKLRKFFYEIYKYFLDIQGNSPDRWFEFSEFESLFDVNRSEINELIFYFDCIHKQKGNYTNYIAINKVSFIIEAVKYLEYGIRVLAEILDFHEFETLICNILNENHYNTIQNYYFSDKSAFKSKDKQKRYEIDVIGLNRNYMLVIDGKQWKHRDVYSSMNKAANIQFQRVLALNKNRDILLKIIGKLVSSSQQIKRILPITIIPIMVTLEENGIRINDNHIPLVAIDKLNSFLQEFQRHLDYYNTIQIDNINIQKTLF
ncbi:MAG: hypothetical protein ACTSR8_11645 [Promethearchaeota archaeon]